MINICLQIMMMMMLQQSHQQQQLQLLIASKTVGTEGMPQFSSRILHSDHSRTTASIHTRAHNTKSTLEAVTSRPAGRYIEINDNQNGQQKLLLFIIITACCCHSYRWFSFRKCISRLQLKTTAKNKNNEDDADDNKANS